MLSVQHALVESSVPIRYQGVSISNALDLTTKQYVDGGIAAYVPVKIQNATTKVEASPASVAIQVQGTDNLLLEQAQTTAHLPVLYDPAVDVLQDRQLATKQYVDSKFADVINNTGLNKEYLQAISNNPVTSNAAITGWVRTVESATLSRIV